jgi:hypothetical protein
LKADQSHARQARQWDEFRQRDEPGLFQGFGIAMPRNADLETARPDTFLPASGSALR